METLIMHPENKQQLQGLKAIAKGLKISVETEEGNYKPDFVATVKKAEKELIIKKLT